MAAETGRSKFTVNRHVYSAQRKLCCANKFDAAVRAMRLGLLQGRSREHGTAGPEFGARRGGRVLLFCRSGSVRRSAAWPCEGRPSSGWVVPGRPFRHRVDGSDLGILVSVSVMEVHPPRTGIRHQQARPVVELYPHATDLCLFYFFQSHLADVTTRLSGRYSVS